MSPRKVNKKEKRREIAIASSELIHEVGIKKLTVSEVAKTAGIGKGTIYEYFENKEDIIFEIINIHIEDYQKRFEEKVVKLKTIEEKIELYFDFVLNDDEENIKHFEGYKEFLSIVLADGNFLMKDFNCKKNDYFKEKLIKIFQESIQKGELEEQALNLADGILTYQKGLALRKMSQINYDVKKDYKKFMGTIFNFIKV